MFCQIAITKMFGTVGKLYFYNYHVYQLGVGSVKIIVKAENK
jgi:hypothetical protein